MCGPWYEYWIFFLVLVGAGDQAQQSRKVDIAQELRVGMTQQEVLDLLGPPDIDYRPHWNHWCYGTSVDFESIVTPDGWLNPIPIQFRFFSYCEDDVVVRWGVLDKAVRIDRPNKFVVADEFQQILDTYVFVQTVFELLTARDAN